MAVLEVAGILLIPALVLRLISKYPVLKNIGAVTLCYIIGFIFSLFPSFYDKELAQTMASVLVAIAMPLVLFSLDISGIRKLASKALLSFGLVILSVLCVSTTAAALSVKRGLAEAGALAGMATGLYIGGTPNMFAIGNALLKDMSLINLANISDSLVGGIYFLLVLTVVKKVYAKVLGNEKIGSTVSDRQASAETEYDYRSIPRDKSSLKKLAVNVLLAVLCLGLGVGLEILINGNMDGSLFIMITVSVLGIALSFVKRIQTVKGSYQIGQYLILAFSLGLSMSIDFQKLISGILPTFLFFACVQLGSILLHFILCKLFRIDGGTALITITAGIYGPPFIAPVANACGDSDLIAPGVICGTFGLVTGNLLGIFLGGILGVIL